MLFGICKSDIKGEQNQFYLTKHIFISIRTYAKRIEVILMILDLIICFQCFVMNGGHIQVATNN